MLGFPVHETAHTLVYYVNDIDFIMTLNRVLPEQEAVAGLLAEPLSILVLAWLGPLAEAIGNLHPAGSLGIALGQVLHRPLLHIGVLSFSLAESDEALAAALLGMPCAVSIMPFFVLYTGRSFLVMWRSSNPFGGYAARALLIV